MPDETEHTREIITTTTTWWERDRRPFLLGWLLPLVLLPLLFWWGQVGVRHHIQRDIRERAEVALAKQGYAGLEVRVRGRDVTLRGSLPAGADVDDVHHVVRSLTGVRHVREELDGAGAATTAPTATTAATATTAPATTAVPATTAAPTSTAVPTTTAAPATTTTATTTTAPPAPITTAAPRTLAISGLTFVSGSAEPTAQGVAAIDAAAAVLRDNPTVRVRIEGHTDAQGSDATNQALSEARANRVRDELVARGIAADRLTAAGFGSTRPIADNATEEGRARNRRIDFVIV